MKQQEIEITINDYKTMCGVIDIASQRGAFKANELAGIGILHNRLIEYIRQIETVNQVNGPKRGASRDPFKGTDIEGKD
jgi:hypothetical protein